MAKASLLDAVSAGVKDHMPWHQRLPKEATAELAAVRERYRKGTLGDQPYLVARLTVAACKANGWDMPSEKAIAKWLTSDN
jgi:hypothetical protein